VTTVEESAGGEASSFTPAALLDLTEQTARRIAKHADAYHEASWYAEAMLFLILPELRCALRKAGLDVPLSAPHSDAHEWMLAQEPALREPAEAEVPAEGRETALYRWYDAADLLLYIGIAVNLGSRTNGHANGSSWMDFAIRSTVERHPSRAAALAAEKAAIKAEQPLFNDVHNRTPEAKARLVEYLIEHGRFDLLAPSVSRG
jgi:predicted GIY-YIG superfamily endonuclease